MKPTCVAAQGIPDGEYGVILLKDPKVSISTSETYNKYNKSFSYKFSSKFDKIKTALHPESIN